MRSDDDRTTPDTDEHHAPEPSRRGRRKTDWPLKRLIEIGTAIGLLWAGFTAISAAIGARWATHREVADAVAPVADTLSAFKSATAARLERVELRQDAADEVHQLLVPMARLQCLQLQRWQSGTLASAAGLPCDSLLRRVR